MLIFRCDASTAIGAGHFYRDLAIAERARAAGEDVVFVCAQLPDALREVVEGLGGQVESVDVAIGGPLDLDRTIKVAQRYCARLVFLDGYQFGSEYAHALDNVVPVVAIDDLATQRWDVSVVVNVNLFARDLTYEVGDHTRLLCGIEYALLRQDFRNVVEVERPDFLFVTMGGGDEHDITARVLDAVADLVVPVEVMVGAGYQNIERLMRRQSSRVRISHRVAQPAALMRGATLAISAAGGTTWELAALGVPVLHIVTADNQRQVAAAAEAHGLSRPIGDLETATVERIREAVIALLDDPARRSAMSAAGQKLVDGRGAERVLNATKDLS